LIPLPEGAYTLQIDTVEMGASRSDKPLLRIRARIIAPVAYENAPLVTIGYVLTPKAAMARAQKLILVTGVSKFEELVGHRFTTTLRYHDAPYVTDSGEEVVRKVMTWSDERPDETNSTMMCERVQTKLNALVVCVVEAQQLAQQKGQHAQYDVWETMLGELKRVGEAINAAKTAVVTDERFDAMTLGPGEAA
jgi:hypothetical protein